MLKAKPIIAGLSLVIPGTLLVYYFEPWIETRTAPGDWLLGGATPAGVVLWLLGFIHCLAGYMSARIAKGKEIYYSGFWCVFGLLFFLVTSQWMPTLFSGRFHLPIFQAGWSGVAVMGLYCLLVTGSGMMAEEDNKRKKLSNEEAALEVASNALDIFF